MKIDMLAGIKAGSDPALFYELTGVALRSRMYLVWIDIYHNIC